MTMPAAADPASTIAVQERVIVHLVRELGGAATVPATAMADEGTKLNVERNGIGALLLTLDEPAHVHDLHIQDDGSVSCSGCDAHWGSVPA
jgi:hypothetical protein